MTTLRRLLPHFRHPELAGFHFIEFPQYVAIGGIFSEGEIRLERGVKSGYKIVRARHAVTLGISIKIGHQPKPTKVDLKKVKKR